MDDAQPKLSDKLAINRTAMASERTLMAWVRTSFSMIGFGFTIYKFLHAAVEKGVAARMRPQGPRNLGLALVCLGTVSLVVASIFLFGGRLARIRGPWRRRGLSAAAGATCGYVFIHLLPELEHAGRVFVEATSHRSLPIPEYRVYVSALAGFVALYGLESLVSWSRHARRSESTTRRTLEPVFLLHIGGFAAYGWLTSYLMDAKAGTPPFIYDLVFKPQDRRRQLAAAFHRLLTPIVVATVLDALPDLSLARHLWPGALGIVLMSFIDTVTAGRSFVRHGEARPVANQELLAAGLANVAGSAFGSMPSAGGMSQTAVNSEAGARSQMAELVTAHGRRSTRRTRPSPACCCCGPKGGCTSPAPSGWARRCGT